MAEHAAPKPAEPIVEEQAPAAAAPAALAPVAASTAAIAGLRPGSGMASQLARAAVRGMGNQAVGRALARSALSDELQRRR